MLEAIYRQEQIVLMIGKLQGCFCKVVSYCGNTERYKIFIYGAQLYMQFKQV